MSPTPGSGVTFIGEHVEQADRAADVGHRLAAEPLGVFEGSDRIVDVAVLLKAAARRGHVEQRHAERVGDDVMYLAGDSSTLVGRGVFGQSGLRLALFDHQQLLGAHQITDQPTDGDEAQIQPDVLEAVHFGRDDQHPGRRRGRE